LPILYSELTKKNKIQPESQSTKNPKMPFSRAKKRGFTATKKGDKGVPLPPSPAITPRPTPYKFHQATKKQIHEKPKK
jgi:hypothetical protein